MNKLQPLTQRILNLGKLTSSEAKIADYFSRHCWNLVFENTTSISKNTGVSKATLVRFLSKLGYSSFSDFLEELRQDVFQGSGSLPVRYSLTQKLLTDEAKDGDLLGHSFACIAQNLEHTHARIDQNQFWEAARLIVQTPGTVYITGQRSSYSLAHMFHNMIHRIRPSCSLIGQRVQAQPELLMDVGPNDLLFAISRNPYVKATLRIASHFVRSQAPVVLLTDNTFNPLHHLATVQIEVDTEGVSIFTSSAAVVGVLEALNTAALKFCDDSVYQRLEQAIDLYDDFDLFCPGRSMEADQIDKLKNHRK